MKVTRAILRQLKTHNSKKFTSRFPRHSFCTSLKKKEEKLETREEIFLDKEKDRPRWARKMNYLLEFHTSAFSISYFGLRAVTVIGLAAALHQTALFTGGEWMAAWVFARLTAKWRQPGNFALAIPVQRMFPILENVKFSKILQYRPDIANIVDDAYVAEYAHMVRRSHRKKRKKSNIDEADVYPASLDRAELRARVQQGFDLSWKRKVESWELFEARKLSPREYNFRKTLHDEEQAKTFRRMDFIDWINDIWAGPVDKYGMSWYVGSKMSSVGTMVGAMLAIRYGMDVVGYMENQPGNQIPDFGYDVTGSLTAAWIVNTCFIPIHFRAASKFTAFWRGTPDFDELEKGTAQSHIQ